MTMTEMRIGGRHGSTTPQPMSLCAAMRMGRVASRFTSNPWCSARLEGLVVTYYGPCEATTEIPNAGKVTLKLDTTYPLKMKSE